MNEIINEYEKLANDEEYLIDLIEDCYDGEGNDQPMSDDDHARLLSFVLYSGYLWNIAKGNIEDSY